VRLGWPRSPERWRWEDVAAVDLAQLLGYQVEMAAPDRTLSLA